MKKLLSHEIIRYGISGGLVTLINVGVYTGLLRLGLRFEVANVVALVLSRGAAFALNKYFVFRSGARGRFWRELGRFMFARGVSGLVDYFGLILLVRGLLVDEVVAKWIVMAAVILLNYALGKFLVFAKATPSKDAACRSENLEKYGSKNPLKRFLARRLCEALAALSLDALRAQSPSPDAAAVDILDVGCGEGFVTMRIREQAPDAVIIGIDASPEALTIARESNPYVRFMEGDVRSLPFEDGGAGVVLLSEVLEHLCDPAAALREAARVAARAVVVSVPHEPWFRLGNLLALKHIAHLGNPRGHIHHWTHRQFQALIRGHAGGSARFYRRFPWSIAVITNLKSTAAEGRPTVR